MNSKILDIVKKRIEANKRYFGSSGASLTHQVFNPSTEGLDAGLARQGLDGERKTSLTLKKFIAAHPNAVLIDSVHLDGMGKEVIEEDGSISGGDTDHVLVVGDNIFIIDSKNWKNKTSYMIKDGVVLRSGKEFPGGSVHCVACAGIWRSYLSDKGHTVRVHPIIHITQPDVMVVQNREWWQGPFKVTCQKGTNEDIIQPVLEEWLEECYDIYRLNEKQINPEIIASIVPNCVKPYDEFKERLPQVAHLLTR